MSSGEEVEEGKEQSEISVAVAQNGTGRVKNPSFVVRINDVLLSIRLRNLTTKYAKHWDHVVDCTSSQSSSYFGHSCNYVLARNDFAL